MKTNIKTIVNISITAAIYVAVCFVLTPISFGPIQLRFSEILCLLSIDFIWGYIGVILGCLISNTFIGGLGIIDVFFGTLATVIGCGLAYLFRNKRINDYPLLSVLCIILCNGIIIGIELGFVLNTTNLIPLYILQVSIGETIVMLIGLPIYRHVLPLIQRRLS